jgi:hypothetical protein
LDYFKSPTDQAPKDSIRLRNAVVSAEKAGPADPGFSYLDVTPSDAARTYRLRGPHATIDRWATALKSTVQALEAKGGKGAGTPVIVNGTTVGPATRGAGTTASSSPSAQAQQKRQSTVPTVDVDVGGQQQAQIKSQIQLNTEEIRRREEGVKALEQDMMLVHELMVDTARLVANQGTMLDSIELHLGTAAGNVESGLEELRAAKKYS